MAAALLLAWSSLAPAAPQEKMPERVVSLRHHYLSPLEYQGLMDDWRRWTKSHPTDPLGWAQLARAAMYAHAPCEEYIGYAEKAVRLGPHHAEALAMLGRVKWAQYCPGQPRDPNAAIDLLEQALRLDPSLDDPRYTLWSMYRSQGRNVEADAQLRALLDRGAMPEPLVDMGYNLLVGLEPNALLLTNGDNDTYPVVALQVARGFRTDVTVINLSMLNTRWFRRELRNTRSVPVPELPEDTDNTGGEEALKQMIAAWTREGGKRPLYAAVTIPDGAHAIPPHLSLEGVVYRILPRAPKQDVDRAVTRRNLDQRYRLQSATSVAVDWKEWAGLRTLILNYANASFRLAVADAAAGDAARARAGAIRTLEMLEFHRNAPEFARTVLDTWARWEPRSAEVAKWKKRMKV